jgi:hypothetical protein
LLKIMFRLEQELGFEISRGELFPEATFRARPEWLWDGKPYASLNGHRDDQPMRAPQDLFTVGWLA